MLFSVIVPVYKVEPYIHRCVDSLLAQVYQDFEIILVDDGGEDACPRICDDYAAKDSRITVIHKPNGGLSDARNAGLRTAKGEYVLFVDSDDAVQPNALQCFSEIAQANYDIICADGNVIGGNLCFAHISEYGAFSGEAFLKRSLTCNQMPMAAVLNLYRRAFLLENQLFFKDGILHEDEQFTPRAFLKADTVFNSGIVFYDYYIHGGSITRSPNLQKNAQDLYDTCCELSRLYSELTDRGLQKLLLDSLVVKYLHIFQVGRIYQYGKAYIHKRFVIQNAYRVKTRLKACLFCFNCRLYYLVNRFSKALK